MRFLLEKPANLNDIKDVVFLQHLLSIDTTVYKGCGKDNTQDDITVETIKSAILEMEKMPGLELAPDSASELAQLKRAVIYSLLVFIGQRKKKFSLQIMQHLVNILNSESSELLNILDLSDLRSLLLLFTLEIDRSPVEEKEGGDIKSDIPFARITSPQLKLISDELERITIFGCLLFSYLKISGLQNLSIISHALFLEAIGCNMKYLEEFKAVNVNRREIVNFVALVEHLFFKRNNKKGPSKPEFLEFSVLAYRLKNMLDETKAALKNNLGIEFNPSLKSSFGDTKYLSQIWSFDVESFGRALELVFQSSKMINNRVESLRADHDHPLAKNEQNELLDKISQILQKKNLLSIASASILTSRVFESLIYNEISSSWFVIRQRALLDLTDPKNKRSKLRFKIGEGSNIFLNKIAFGEDLETISEEIKAAGEESYKVEYKDINPLKIDWRSKEIQSKIQELFETTNQERRIPKVAKGVLDCLPEDKTIKNIVFDTARNVFKMHGGVEIDTPVFELKETLMGKYGEEGNKLIYELKDQGGELLCLRYDLTVPFARYVATNNYERIKRFHIGKVYRRDQPNPSKGRFREFYQCDFDITGPSDPMVADAEILTIITQIMNGYDLGKYEIKLCHRVLLEAIVEVAGAPLDRFKTICSSIDKLDKEPWSAIAKELTEDKGINPEAVAKLEKIVYNRGTIGDLVKKLEAEQIFGENEKAKKTLEELKILDRYLQVSVPENSIVLDLSLARGLDYYTGLIYEVVVPDSGLGSVGGGGRYDGLVGMFNGKNMPSIGVSIGVERIFLLMREKLRGSAKDRGSETEVLVATIGKGLVEERMRLASELWHSGIKAEIMYQNNAKPQKQLNYALENKIPFITWIGENEITEEKVSLKVNFLFVIFLVYLYESRRKCCQERYY